MRIVDESSLIALPQQECCGEEGVSIGPVIDKEDSTHLGWLAIPATTWRRFAHSTETPMQIQMNYNPDSRNDAAILQGVENETAIRRENQWQCNKCQGHL
eukprot:CAMPEP_0178373068 /NCGR_PEP_ID=MMETSP0689_2-20121128/1675_1 /TAXON_ID=160604 /ORGANISM="Amphidinium massartii, Strain CS-259" /LENGTH=99 /DNA_ID=CAMNT_0019993005 /DNA_START=582 /DNA_END=882 /DNA_ORIENTATION=-